MASSFTDITIYALTDPESGMVRYVGKSVDPKARLKQHLQPSQLNRYKSKKNSWIKNLQSYGLVPELITLEQVPSEMANQSERKWIATYRTLSGDYLTNGTEGGDGGSVTDPEARKRISDSHRGRKVSDATKAKMSATQKSRMTPSERERLRSISNGTPPISSGSDNPMSFLTESQVVELRTKAASGYNLKQLALDNNLKYQSLHQIVTGRTWKDTPGPILKTKSRQRLTNEDVVEIRRLSGQNVPNNILALQYNVDASHVSKIINNASRIIAHKEAIQSL